MVRGLKLGGILAIIIVILIVLLVLNTSEPSESQYLLIKSGDTLEIEGPITSIEPINTSYGLLKFINLNFDTYKEKKLLDDEFFNTMGYNEALKIIDFSGTEYAVGDNYSTTLHFEDFRLSDARCLWVKEFGVYLTLLTALQDALDATSYAMGIGLVMNSTINDGSMRYEVLTQDNNTYALDMFNVTLLKFSIKIPDDFYEENILFSEAFNKTVGLMASHYVLVSGGAGETIDFMNSLEDGVSQNETIEFVDVNSNGLLDDYDVFNVNISPTFDETVIDTYLLNIGDGLISWSESDVSGFKYIINWYDGAIEFL